MREATCLQVGLLIRKDTRSPAENETSTENSLELGSAPDEGSEFTRLGFKTYPQLLYLSDWWFICLGFLVCKMRLPHPPIRSAVSRETSAQYPLTRRQSKLCHTTTNSTVGVSRLCTRGELCSLLEHCSGPTVSAVSLPAWVAVRKNLSHTKMEQGQPHSCPLIPQ